MPILGIMAEPIRVEQKDEPSNEEVEKVKLLLVEKMQKLFEKYKGLYGWDKKRLVIK